jgi:hypothetical protein
VHGCHAGKQANRVNTSFRLVSVVASLLGTCEGHMRSADSYLVQRVSGTGPHAEALSSGPVRAAHRRGSPPAAPEGHDRHVQGEATAVLDGSLSCPASHMQPCNADARAWARAPRTCPWQPPFALTTLAQQRAWRSAWACRMRATCRVCCPSVASCGLLQSSS